MAKAVGSVKKEQKFLEGLAEMLQSGNAGRSVEGYTLLPKAKAAKNPSVEVVFDVQVEQNGSQMVLVKLKGAESAVTGLMNRAEFEAGSEASEDEVVPSKEEAAK